MEVALRVEDGPEFEICFDARRKLLGKINEQLDCLRLFRFVTFDVYFRPGQLSNILVQVSDRPSEVSGWLLQLEVQVASESFFAHQQS